MVMWNMSQDATSYCENCHTQSWIRMVDTLLLRGLVKNKKYAYAYIYIYIYIYIISRIYIYILYYYVYTYNIHITWYIVWVCVCIHTHPYICVRILGEWVDDGGRVDVRMNHDVSCKHAGATGSRFPFRSAPADSEGKGAQSEQICRSELRTSENPPW